MAIVAWLGSLKRINQKKGRGVTMGGTITDREKELLGRVQHWTYKINHTWEVRENIVQELRELRGKKLQLTFSEKFGKSINIPNGEG